MIGAVTVLASIPDTQIPQKAPTLMNPGLAEIELAGDADIEVESDRSHYIAADRDQKALEQAGEISAL